MCLVTERLRSREGVLRPEAAVGVLRPFVMPGECIMVDDGDIGAINCVLTTFSLGFGDGRGEILGVISPTAPGAANDFELK